jgi:hypothetical protein
MDIEMFKSAKRIPSPDEYTANFLREKTDAAKIRYDLIYPALRDDRCIADANHRNALFNWLLGRSKCLMKPVFISPITPIKTLPDPKLWGCIPFVCDVLAVFMKPCRLAAISMKNGRGLRFVSSQGFAP